MSKINRHTEYALEQLSTKVKLEEREIGIFISRDCIVTETYTGKTYKYRAYNYITGETKYMGYKKEAISSIDYENLLTKIADYNFYNISYPESGEELIEYIFNEVFENFGFNKRHEQIELSKHMYIAMIQKAISLSDVAVGLGKTHAYLVAAVVYQICGFREVEVETITHPIIISTSSKRLQNAIVKDYLPEISNMLMAHGIIDEEITAVIRKGRNNYICDLRLRNYVNCLDPQKKNSREYELLKRALDSNHADLENVVGISRYDRERINVIAGHCKSCPKGKTCSYRRYLKILNAPHYNFQVTNHNYMIADILKRSREERSLLPRHHIVICDEAHKLIEVYSDMQTVVLGKDEILSLIKRIKPQAEKNKRFKKMNQLCNSIIENTHHLFNEDLHITIENHQDESSKYSIQDSRPLLRQFNRIKKNLQQLVLTVPDYNRKEQIAFEKLGDIVDCIMSEDSIRWVEMEQTRVLIKAIPKNIHQMLGQDIFKDDVAVLLTSGTLSVGGNFSYSKSMLGIEHIKRVKEMYKVSPFNYYQNTLLYQANDLPYPNPDDDQYIKAVADRILTLIQASYGHALVLFTSYEMMSKVYGLLKNEQVAFPLFILSKGKSSVLQTYRKSKKGVLLACGGMWEGVNLTGDLLSHLIIVKLPFPVPDPIAEYKKEEMDEDDLFKEEILIPQMLTKLKQGYGRAVRTETDTAVISILDIRANGRYKDAVRKALPNCRVTHNIKEITSFIQVKKSPEYFL
ncbi:MAG: ATP-dependent DNA helicase [Maledivibacter sp.]|jgi:ATP-dependent DNA helicase DinG|nr:ATP-dependent DNA helicase [Maledivibacter sp.]